MILKKPKKTEEKQVTYKRIKDLNDLNVPKVIPRPRKQFWVKRIFYVEFYTHSNYLLNVKWCIQICKEVNVSFPYSPSQESIGGYILAKWKSTPGKRETWDPAGRCRWPRKQPISSGLRTWSPETQEGEIILIGDGCYRADGACEKSEERDQARDQAVWEQG